jgi:hypothetical protein
VTAYDLFDGDLDLSRDRPRFSWRRASVGERIGVEVDEWDGEA